MMMMIIKPLAILTFFFTILPVHGGRGTPDRASILTTAVWPGDLTEAAASVSCHGAAAISGMLLCSKSVDKVSVLFFFIIPASLAPSGPQAEEEEEEEIKMAIANWEYYHKPLSSNGNQTILNS